MQTLSQALPSSRPTLQHSRRFERAAVARFAGVPPPTATSAESRVYRLAPGVRLADDGILPTADLPTGERLGMQSPALGLIRMCAESAPMSTLVEAAVFAFEIDRPEAMRMIEDFCGALLAAGVIEVDTAAQMQPVGPE